MAEIVTPDAAREALYRRLYAAWPEWTSARLVWGGGPHVAALFHSLWNAGRIEAGHGESNYRVRMGIYG